MLTGIARESTCSAGWAKLILDQDRKTPIGGVSSASVTDDRPFLPCPLGSVPAMLARRIGTTHASSPWHEEHLVTAERIRARWVRREKRV